MKAIIVGGGIAGPATALALRKIGMDSVVLERRVASAGSYLTVAPNGLDALEALDALDVARREGFESKTNLIYGATGRKLGEISLGQQLDNGLTALTMKRSSLAAGLAAEAGRRGTVIHRGAAVVSVVDLDRGGDDTDGGVVVTLADGTQHAGDFLVGADGVHSLVRGAIDPYAPAARYVGLTNFGGITRAASIATDLQPEAWHFVFGKAAFFGAHPTPEGDVVWFLNVPEPEISRERRMATSTEQWRAQLLGLVKNDAGPAAELVATGSIELAGDNTYDLQHVPTWTRGRMVVVGDAAHAPASSSGQGASIALEDAVVLAQALRDRCVTPADLPAAFAAYELARRGRVEKIVAAGARSSTSKIPGPIGRHFQEAVLRLVFRFAVTDEKTAWINGHRIDWGAPV
jgi:2-polyprenyl-6-methoxyphenol hydroxylase-like FAD-dependent oxidoreductase